MRKMARISLLLSAAALCLSLSARAQNPSGGLEITARITPSAARPEPVRQFTFYVLTRSYEDICKEVESSDVVPPKDQFIESLDVSKELKAWMKAHDVIDLTMPDLDKALTVDDIMNTPEFLLAYQRSNSGGVTKGLPLPKFKESDKKEHPDKYAKEKQEYLTALRKFIQQNPATISGVELELDGVNPQRKWALLQGNHKRKVQRVAPELAQTKYLATKVDTDLDGHAVLQNLAPGNYWVSSLNLDASAGDARVRWDVPVTIQPGQTVRIELTNLNAADTLTASVP
jgi:hypothetical protein